MPMRLPKLKLNVGITLEANVIEMDEKEILACVRESQWQLGTAMIGGVRREVERRWCLDEWAYRMGSNTLDPSCIESYLPSEFLEWRDS